MFIPYITTIMQLFSSIFMKFFSFPIGDLGFNLGTLMIFLILLKFAFRVILPELMLPTLGLGYAVEKIAEISFPYVKKGVKVVRKELATDIKNWAKRSKTLQFVKDVVSVAVKV